MSALSSLFNKSDITVKQSNKVKSPVNNRDKHKERRSEKTSRTPKIVVREGSDVLTEICAEIGKRVVSNPDIRTGKLFELSRDSNLALNQSDIIILISSAILDEMGNTRGADKSLSASNTVGKMYEKMGLNDQSVRRMFVTALISVNPAIVQIIEASITLALEELRFETKAPHSNIQLENSMKLMKIDGSVTGSQFSSMAEARKDVEIAQSVASRTRRNSIQTTPTELKRINDQIAPSDSASNIGGSRKSAKRVSVTSDDIANERDLWNFLKKKKADPNLRFEAQYDNVLQPIQAISNYRRTGLYTNEDFEDKQDYQGMMSQILGARKEGSNIPLSPTEPRKRSRSDESDATYMKEIPPMPKNLVMRSTPEKRTNFNPSLMSEDAPVLHAEPSLIKERAVKIEDYMVDETDDPLDLDDF